ncbi:Ufm1-specific protease 2 [Holothuria leucospilota]|uniref:Ufm1-specific protease 2 n=1 Tax=Holothuria leucospilota TaxID=206669 RepID=A0A9Q1GYU4_HOLLE|nr:Ufm1-specific protease 2 [Holothuria leucospilota]
MAAPMEISFLDSCLKNFVSLKEDCLKTGQIQFGVLLSSTDGKEDNESVIVDIAAISSGTVNPIDDVLLDFQGAVTVNGVLCTCLTQVTMEEAKDIIAQFQKDRKLQDLDYKLEDFVFWDISSEDSTPSKANLIHFNTSANSLQPCDVTVKDAEDYLSTLIYLRLRGSIRVNFTYSSSDDFHEACENAFGAWRERLQSHQVTFRLDGTNLLFGFNERGPTISGSSAKTVADVMKHAQEDEGEGDVLSRKKKSGSKKDKLKEKVIDFNLLFKTGPPSKDENLKFIVPTVQYETFDQKVKSVSLNLPLAIHVPLSTDRRAVTISGHLQRGLLNQLRAMEVCIKNHYETHGVRNVTPYLFKIPSHCHLVTVVYPDGVSEDELESFRKELHVRHMLATDRPYFRRLNAFVFPQDRRDVYLTNTHEGLPPSGVEDGEVSIVQGTYSYHHYMQDQMNDNHWGCAYRSLQTLCSWFRHQGYTDVPIPTHKEIQQILVDVNDKPANFVGTKQWIGSIEVSTVLNQLLDVTSKIMFVSTGADLVSKGRELAHHFKTQGTPVMSGGGAMAHTILGVDFSSKTGELKFLVLDPHYTGEEDLKVIQDKGWCAWQGPDFWDQTVFYNLCLPQRPTLI